MRESNRHNIVINAPGGDVLPAWRSFQSCWSDWVEEPLDGRLGSLALQNPESSGILIDERNKPE
jgi:hypothetical protein